MGQTSGIHWGNVGNSRISMAWKSKNWRTLSHKLKSFAARRPHNVCKNLGFVKGESIRDVVSDTEWKHELSQNTTEFDDETILQVYFPKSQSKVPASLWTLDEEEKMIIVSRQSLKWFSGFEKMFLSSSKSRSQNKKYTEKWRCWGQVYHFPGWKFGTEFPELATEYETRYSHPLISLQPWLCWMNLMNTHPHFWV